MAISFVMAVVIIPDLLKKAKLVFTVDRFDTHDNICYTPVELFN